MIEIINAITMSAAAKINLYLHVTGKRDDGYHLLDSLVAFAGVHDIITIAAANQLTLINQGPFGEGLPTTADNLVIRAAEQLQDLTGIMDGAQITLTKNLPIASGIGGGSADAAAAIKGLVRHWGIHPGHYDLSGLALGLGADVPICLFGQAAFMGGIGEQIDPVLIRKKLISMIILIFRKEIFNHWLIYYFYSRFIIRGFNRRFTFTVQLIE
jgi:4-diphosphocytidyl-2-C-methyl-D-erythritol kinase